MRKYIYLTILFALAAFACTEEIDFEKSLIDKQLVVNAFITPDSLFKVQLYNNVSINQSNIEPLRNANILLFEEGKEVEKLTPDFYLTPTYNYNNNGELLYDTTYFYSGKNTRAVVGKSYEIKASHPDFEDAICNTTIPYPVQIEGIDTSSNHLSSEYEERIEFKFKLKFTDPADTENYYRLVIKETMGKEGYTVINEADTSYFINISSSSYSYFNSNDPVFTYENSDASSPILGGIWNDYGIFSDAMIQGENYEVSFSQSTGYYGYWGNKEKPKLLNKDRGEFYAYTIYLQSITRDAYLYMKSIDAQSYYNDIPFVEPVTIYSNVENGLGIFGSYSSSSIQTTFGEYPMEGIEYR